MALLLVTGSSSARAPAQTRQNSSTTMPRTPMLYNEPPSLIACRSRNDAQVRHARLACLLQILAPLPQRAVPGDARCDLIGQHPLGRDMTACRIAQAAGYGRHG